MGLTSNIFINDNSKDKSEAKSSQRVVLVDGKSKKVENISVYRAGWVEHKEPIRCASCGVNFFMKMESSKKFKHRNGNLSDIKACYVIASDLIRAGNKWCANLAHVSDNELEIAANLMQSLSKKQNGTTTEMSNLRAFLSKFKNYRKVPEIRLPERREDKDDLASREPGYVLIRAITEAFNLTSHEAELLCSIIHEKNEQKIHTYYLNSARSGVYKSMIYKLGCCNVACNSEMPAVKAMQSISENLKMVFPEGNKNHHIDWYVANLVSKNGSVLTLKDWQFGPAVVANLFYFGVLGNC